MNKYLDFLSKMPAFKTMHTSSIFLLNISSRNLFILSLARSLARAAHGTQSFIHFPCSLPRELVLGSWDDYLFIFIVCCSRNINEKSISKSIKINQNQSKSSKINPNPSKSIKIHPKSTLGWPRAGLSSTFCDFGPSRKTNGF